MTPQDALLSIAEISIGLAGFSGLVAAFIQPTGHSWQPEQKTRIVILILLSFGMIVCSLAPYALAGISASSAIIWGMPMIAFGTLSIGLLIYWLIVSGRRHFKLQFPWFSRPFIFVAVSLQIMVLLSGLGLVFPYSPALFLLGFLSTLVFGANVFLALLYSVWNK